MRGFHKLIDAGVDVSMVLDQDSSSPPGPAEWAVPMTSPCVPSGEHVDV
jgi:hypothetical protein